MRRIAKWVMVVGMLIGVAMPKVAYACTPTPIYWKLTIHEMWLYAADLPDGFTIDDSSGEKFLFTNETDESVRLTVPHWRSKIIDPNSTLELTKADLYPALFPSQRHGDDGVYLDPYDEETTVTTVPLMDEFELALKHGGNEYSILARFYYDIEYVPSDHGAGCGLGYMIMFLGSILVPASIGVILIAGIVAAIRSAIKNRRAAP